MRDPIFNEYADERFGPKVTSVLADAFDDAWHRLQESHAPYSADEFAPAARTILAKYILDQAQAGERDSRWLADGALLYLTRQKLSRTPATNTDH